MERAPRKEVDQTRTKISAPEISNLTEVFSFLQEILRRVAGYTGAGIQPDQNNVFLLENRQLASKAVENVHQSTIRIKKKKKRVKRADC